MSHKLVVFAHIPPPHHGQSVMVQLMLDGFDSGKYGDFEIFHVDARFSDSMKEIGSQSITKVWRAIRFSATAIFYRFRYGVKNLYYVPAPPKQSAILRDLIVLGICRPFFPKIYLHWHAVGLGAWTQEAQKSASRKTRVIGWITRLIFKSHFCSLPLTKWGKIDALHFEPQDVRIVPNGTDDPCPDFAVRVLKLREHRLNELNSGDFAIYQIAYMGHCHGEKGLWDAMEAVAIASDQLRQQQSPIKLKLVIAGEFPSDEDHKKFQTLKSKFTSQFQLQDEWIEYIGFVIGTKKSELLERSDCLCFPTKYSAESFGLVATEAFAYGIPPICSDWRMLPDLMRPINLPVAKVGDPNSMAEEIIASVGRDDPQKLRDYFLNNFTSHQHLLTLSASLTEHRP